MPDQRRTGRRENIHGVRPRIDFSEGALNFSIGTDGTDHRGLGQGVEISRHGMTFWNWFEFFTQEEAK
jgi:hypothetical protein